MVQLGTVIKIRWLLLLRQLRHLWLHRGLVPRSRRVWCVGPPPSEVVAS